MKYILAVLFMTFSMQSAADNWLCITDKATGFVLKNGSWESRNFASGDKYMIKEADSRRKTDDVMYQVNQFGDNIPNWLCGDFKSVVYKGMLICRGFAAPGDTFKYNPRTGHFLATYTNGYVHDSRSGDGVSTSTDTSTIEIGKCSKL